MNAPPPRDRRTQYLELADGIGSVPHPDDQHRLQELAAGLSEDDRQSLPMSLTIWDQQLRRALTAGPSVPSQWTTELRTQLGLQAASAASFPIFAEPNSSDALSRECLPVPVSVDPRNNSPVASPQPRIPRRRWLWNVLALSLTIVVLYALRPHPTRLWSDDQVAQGVNHWLKANPPANWQDWQSLKQAPKDQFPNAIQGFSRVGWRNCSGPEGIATRIYQLPLDSERFAYLIRLSAMGDAQMPSNFSLEPTHHYRSDWSLWVCSNRHDAAIWVLAHDGELADIQARLSPTQLTQHPGRPSLFAWIAVANN